MVAYSFQKRFVQPIRVGLSRVPLSFDPPPKLQTIRAIGKRRHVRPGEVIQLYCGMRTRDCFKIGEARCTEVQTIKMSRVPWDCKIYIDNRLVWYFNNLDDFARLDGFARWADMRDFWRKEHPDADDFEGVLIKWKPLQ